MPKGPNRFSKFKPTRVFIFTLFSIALFSLIFGAIRSHAFWHTQCVMDYDKLYEASAEYEPIARKEITTKNPWWVGEYYCEDPRSGRFEPHGFSILISPHLYFDERKGDMFPIQEFGDVRDMGDGRLFFEPRIASQIGQDQSYVAKPYVLNVVRWGDRQYLVRSSSEFLQAIEKHDEPRSCPQGNFLIRIGDWEKPVSGRPQFPAEK